MKTPPPLTPEQAAILTCYTGITFGHFNAAHKLAEEKFNRPIFTHEFANKELTNQLREYVKDDFMRLCGK